MQIFDTSSMVHAWDNYPYEQFPPLWLWIEEQIDGAQIAMSAVAMEEVENVSPDCHSWLKKVGVTVIPVSNEILNISMEIKHLLEIVDDKYHADGVGENDILIIATAKSLGVALVSDEGQQATLPKLIARYKIPAVCNLQSVDVVCKNFIDYLKLSGAIFGA